MVWYLPTKSMAKETKIKTTKDQEQLVCREHLPTYFNKCQVSKSSCEMAIQRISMRELAAGYTHLARHHSRLCHCVNFDLLSHITDRWPWINRIVQATRLTSVNFLNLYTYATCSSLLSESKLGCHCRPVVTVWYTSASHYFYRIIDDRVVNFTFYSSVVHRLNWPNIRCILAIAFTKNSNPQLSPKLA